MYLSRYIDKVRISLKVNYIKFDKKIIYQIWISLPQNKSQQQSSPSQLQSKQPSQLQSQHKKQESKVSQHRSYNKILILIFLKILIFF